ncbi:hypothetical protein CPAV1605_1373 [seawater metagenome]|uniref:Uncharacterized protein n=1 Tax=seawater metagenome TaxID=1561972 RepID=A0A5E8CK80_9ZZZZ
MSTVTYRFENNLSTKGKDGVKTSIKQSIIDGAKGLSFQFLVKEGEKNFYRVSGKEMSKDKFEITEKVNDDITKTEMSVDELHKFLKSKKGDLDFVVSYIKNDRAKYQAGGAKRRKAASKKTSKKTSKKAAKKTSRKAAKKTSKKASKKSKKVAKKTSKKASKKAAKKGSKKSKKAAKKTSKKAAKKTSKKSKKAAKKGSKKSKKVAKKATKKGSKKAKSARKY